MSSIRPTSTSRVFCFVVERAGALSQAHFAVPPRRVVLVCSSEEEARAGVGAYSDEQLQPARASFWERGVARLPVQSAEIADFFQALGASLACGHPLLGALAMAARQARTPRMRGVVGSLMVAVSRGREFHAALAAFPPVFRAEQVAIAEAASHAGLQDLGGMFSELARIQRRDARMGGKLLAAMAYPGLLLVLAVVASLILEIKALPPMVELFASMGVKLPGITAFFYAGSRFLSSQGFWVFPLLLIAGLAGFRLVIRFFSSRTGQHLACRLPYVGPVVCGRALVRALGIFVLMRESGAGSRDLFEHASRSAGNARIAEYFQSVHRRVARGMPLEESFMAERHQLGAEGVRVAGRMELGNQGADFTGLLRGLIEELNDQVETRLSILPRLLEIPMLLLCGLVVGGIMVAMFLPYPSLLADVARQMR